MFNNLLNRKTFVWVKFEGSDEKIEALGIHIRKHFFLVVAFKFGK